MSKLGLHIAGTLEAAGLSLEQIVAAHPRLIVITDDGAALTALDQALGDRCLLVSGTESLGTDWGTFWDGPAGRDLNRALALWEEAARPLLEAAPFAYWMSFQGVRDRAHAAAYAAFEAARVERLAALDRRACVGNFATGRPDPRDPAWKGFLTACRAAQAHGGLLGLQKFGALYLWTGYGSNEWTGRGFRLERKFPEAYHQDASLCLGYRALYRDWLEPVGLGALPLVITACGLGPTADAITAALSVDGQPTAGWATCAPTWRRRDGEHDAVDFYLRQLEWYDAQIARDPVLIGAAVAGWGAHDASAIDGRLAEGLLAHIAAGPPPTDSLRPTPSGWGLPAMTAATSPNPAQPTAPPAPGAGGRYYYVAVDHPEVFDALWREGQPLAEAARALLTWREAGGRFFLQTDDPAIWRRLYQYGQLLAQRLNAGIDGGEIDPASRDP